MIIAAILRDSYWRVIGAGVIEETDKLVRPGNVAPRMMTPVR